MTRIPAVLVLALLAMGCGSADQTPTLHLEPSRAAAADEIEASWTDSLQGVRYCLSMPASFALQETGDALLILYALPNGNTIEQTKGRRVRQGMDWHFGIQHIAAQTRVLRQLFPNRATAVAYLEAAGLSWPRWRRERKDPEAAIARIVDTLRAHFRDARLTIALTGHSGGGSFIFGFIDGQETIPADVERICFLDSNYGYSDSAGHTSKLLSWLRSDASRVLAVIAYDDREIMIDGKKVIGPEGGTYRRTMAMAQCLGSEVQLDAQREDSLLILRGMHGQIELLVHLNPTNAILHTRLVGEMNGFLHAMTLRGRTVVPFKGPAVYEGFVEGE